MDGHHGQPRRDAVAHGMDPGGAAAELVDESSPGGVDRRRHERVGIDAPGRAVEQVHHVGAVAVLLGDRAVADLGHAEALEARVQRPVGGRARELEADGRLTATRYNDQTKQETVRTFGRVIVEHGTLALGEVYESLEADSVSGGETDPGLLADSRMQAIGRDRDRCCRLFRIGDAVASGNVDAAILDAVRLCKDFCGSVAAPATEMRRAC